MCFSTPTVTTCERNVFKFYLKTYQIFCEPKNYFGNNLTTFEKIITKVKQPFIIH